MNEASGTTFKVGDLQDRIRLPRFSPPEEARYNQQFTTTNIRNTTIGLSVISGIVLFHLITSYVFFPEGMPPVASALRLGLSLASATFIAMALTKFVDRRPETAYSVVNGVGIGTMVAVCCALTAMIMDAEAVRRSMAYGVPLLFLVLVYMLFRIRFLYAVAGGLATTAYFLYAAHAHGVYDFSRFKQIASFFALMNVIGIIVSYLLERQDRLIYLTLNEIDLEQDRSDAIIQSLLPGTVASALKNSAGAAAELHEEVTMLSADIVGFTKLAGSIAPEELMLVLSSVFSELDRIVERHGVEKIKTIGDAYVASSGLPSAQFNHAVHVCRAAGEMLRAMRHLSLKFGFDIDLRIGIHTGQVVAGVLGGERPSYDVWGGALLVTKEIEVSAEPGTARLSEATMRHVVQYFDLEPSEPVATESGTIRTYALASMPTRHFVLKAA